MPENSRTDMIDGIYRRIWACAVRGKRINSVPSLAELLFWRLHFISDDWGRFDADPGFIKYNACRKREEITVENIPSLLHNLSELVTLYQADGEDFGEIVDWERFQPAGKNGKRLQKYPSRTLNYIPDRHLNGGILDIPGESRLFLDIPGESASPIPIPIPIPNNTLTPSGVTSKYEVSEIYEIYPRKVGKESALKAIQKTIEKGKSAEWLKERVALFAKSPAGQAGQYTPHPATWFTQGRYDDDPKEWARTDFNGNPAPKEFVRPAPMRGPVKEPQMREGGGCND